MDQRAQATRTGWKKSLISRDVSLVRPKALVPVTYCEMFPGNTATKNAATTQPT